MTLEPRRPNQAPTTAHRSRQPAPRDQQTNPTSTSDNHRPHLVRVTVNLTYPADRALTTLAISQQLSKTDIINRALQIAEVVHKIAPNGHLTICHPDGIQSEVYLL